MPRPGAFSSGPGEGGVQRRGVVIRAIHGGSVSAVGLIEISGEARA